MERTEITPTLGHVYLYSHGRLTENEQRARGDKQATRHVGSAAGGLRRGEKEYSYMDTHAEMRSA